MPKVKPGEQKEKTDAKLVVNAALDRIRSAFNELTRTVIHIEIGNLPGEREEKSIEDFAVAMSTAMTMTDVYARLRTLNEVRKHVKLEGDPEPLSALTLGTFSAMFQGDDTPDDIAEWLELPFVEAMEAISSREPEIASGYIEASDAYARMGFALARKTAGTISEQLMKTEELQAIIVDAMGKGLGADGIVEKTFDLDPKWDENYMRIVAQTNLASAYVAGRERQMRSPAVAPHILAHRFVSALLPTTRPNHRAAHGFIAPPDHPVWDSISPLLGYQCFCRKQPIFKVQAKQFGLTLDDQGRMAGNIVKPEGAFADSISFGKRTDKTVYEGPPGGRAGFGALWVACGKKIRHDIELRHYI